MQRQVPDLDTTGARVEQLLDELATTGGPAIARCGEQLVQALIGLYGAGLARIVELAGEPALARFADDQVVSGLLVLHDLHPLSTEQRVRSALERVRPYLGQHAGDVELLGVAGGVVRLRLAGSCHGCSASEATVRQAIELAITEAAPEVAEVVVEPAASQPEPPLLQIQSGVRR